MAGGSAGRLTEDTYMTMNRKAGNRLRRSILATSAALCLGVLALTTIPVPQAQAGLLRGALGGALVGGIIGGRRGAAAGAIVGGVAGAARAQGRRDAATYRRSHQARYQRQRTDMDQQRLDKERLELERERLRLERERLELERQKIRSGG